MILDLSPPGWLLWLGSKAASNVHFARSSPRCSATSIHVVVTTASVSPRKTKLESPVSAAQPPSDCGNDSDASASPLAVAQSEISLHSCSWRYSSVSVDSALESAWLTVAAAPSEGSADFGLAALHS